MLDALLCLVELCGPCIRVVHLEYIMSDLNYTSNIISLVKTEISNPLKICSLPYPNNNNNTLSPVIFCNDMNKSCTRDYPVNY